MTHCVGVRTELRGKQASTSGMARMQASYLHVREATLQVVKGGTVDQWDGLCKETVICFSRHLVAPALCTLLASAS
jgi:hypothetical protein